MGKSRNQKINIVFFLCIFAAYLLVTVFLFHRQSVNYAKEYVSDMLPYIAAMQGLDTGYDFPYPIMFAVGSFFMLFTTPEHSMALAVTGLNGLSACVLKFYFDRYLAVIDQDNWKRGVLSTCLTFSMLFISMLYPLTYLGKTGEPLEYLRYKGVFSPNPYHNATYLATRPFAIVAFFLLADLFTVYEKEEKQNLGKYIAFSVFLLLTTMTKPSFTLVAVSTAGLIMLWRWIRSGWKGWKPFFKLGIWFIPTFIALLYQFSGVFMGGGDDILEKGIGIGFLKAWSTATDNVGRAILLGLAFPLTVLIFQYRKLRTDHAFRLSWQIMIMSIVQLLFLYEKGFRMQHLNFAWGYMHGLFFVFLTGLILLTEDTIHKREKKWKLLLQWGVFALHLICGLDYFRVLLVGGLLL